MNIQRMQEIASNIEILRSARFYLLNGLGTIGFKTKSINAVYPNSINGTAALVLIKKLNNAIQPILEAEAAQLQAEIKQMAIEGK